MIFKEIFGESYRQKISPLSDGKSILLCNYRIELTAGEYSIVSFLSIKSNWIPRTEISVCTSIKESSIPVHIANINKKASSITGRKLLEGNRSGEYRISKYI